MTLERERSCFCRNIFWLFLETTDAGSVIQIKQTKNGVFQYLCNLCNARQMQKVLQTYPSLCEFFYILPRFVQCSSNAESFLSWKSKSKHLQRLVCLQKCFPTEMFFFSTDVIGAVQAGSVLRHSVRWIWKLKNLLDGFGCRSKSKILMLIQKYLSRQFSVLGRYFIQYL